jgi:hypothetical protein
MIRFVRLLRFGDLATFKSLLKNKELDTTINLDQLLKINLKKIK